MSSNDEVVITSKKKSRNKSKYTYIKFEDSLSKFSDQKLLTETELSYIKLKSINLQMQFKKEVEYKQKLNEAIVYEKQRLKSIYNEIQNRSNICNDNGKLVDLLYQLLIDKGFDTAVMLN